VWAHRGASGDAPENTLAAFRRAAELGADGVEFDVQLSRDGEIVVIHDETVDRTTNGCGQVVDLTWEELSRLDAAVGWDDFAPQPIPSLRQVLEALAATELDLNIELKDSVVPYPGLGDKVSRLIDEFDLGHRVTLSSFNHCSLARLRQSGSMLRTGVLFTDILYQPWAYAPQLWATALHPELHYVDYVLDLVQEAHLSHLEVNVWTVNQPAEIERMAARGVDAIITDHPGRARALLR
jgi:glycerophosphoryl diester phosphodiesterase